MRLVLPFRRWKMEIGGYWVPTILFSAINNDFSMTYEKYNIVYDLLESGEPHFNVIGWSEKLLFSASTMPLDYSRFSQVLTVVQTIQCDDVWQNESTELHKH